MRLKRSNAGALLSTLARLATLAAMAAVALACATPPALALPEGRVYEMVTPPYKGGYGASAINAVAPDGESVAFASHGAFAGAPASLVENVYVARRGASGWSTSSLMSPASLWPGGIGGLDFSATMESTLNLGEPGPNHRAAEQGAERVFLLHPAGAPDSEANWEVAGMTLKTLEEKPFVLQYRGASGDLCHILFGTADALLPEAKEATSDVEKLYDLARGCGGVAPSLRLVGVRNKLGPSGEPELIDPSCPVRLGGSFTSQRATNEVAAGGRVIFFTTNATRSEGIKCDDTSQGAPVPGNPAIVFARVGGERTLQVSASLPAQCVVSAPCHSAVQARAEFQGASEDGSRVFFTTAQPLVSEDVDATNDLYMARIGCAGGEAECEPSSEVVRSLVQVSHAGGAAEVQGVVAVAPDGSRVYFVARGVLSGANAQGGVPVGGADNLYVYEPDPEHAGQFKTVFVADLCSGPGLSGGVEDLRCPLGGQSDAALWGNKESSSAAQTAGRDGGFLLFSSYGRLVAGDTDTASDVYRYDAQTGALDRVSVGEDGADANGNNSAFDATIPNTNHTGNVSDQAGMTARAISEDGSRVVFTTAEPLSPQAGNGLVNAYEWHKEPGWGEGRVSLVSTGSSVEPVEHVLISPSGRDIFFQTTQGIVAQDTDGAPDIYDARLGGGFPPPPAERQRCSSDACQGALTNPAPLLLPGSVSQAPGQNFAPAAVKAAVKPKAKPKAKSCKKGYVKKKRKCVQKPKKSAKGKK
jgi:hypothetical protein